MAETSENLIAQGRSDEIVCKMAYVYFRKQLRDASEESDEGRIYKKTGTRDFLLEQGGISRKDRAAYHDYVDGSMLTEDAICGGTNKAKHQCPFTHIGFINALKRDWGSKEIGLEPGHEPLFDLYIGVNISFADQKTVSRALIRHKVVAAKPKEKS